MTIIEHNPADDLKPCVECPHIFPQKFRNPLCGKAAYRDPITGKPYQTCKEARSRRGVNHINGERQQCLGYDTVKHATLSRKVNT